MNSFPQFDIFKPSYPPIIDPKDLIKKPVKRAPNAFLIYRKMYFLQAKKEGYHMSMTAISTMAGRSWKQEPEEVKCYYRLLSKEASDYLNEMYPNPKRKITVDKINDDDAAEPAPNNQNVTITNQMIINNYYFNII